ncbi:hypothetical protein CesoFtcFv8_000307 [Champsocephalus esox]|uniref:Uncharacterized protein n=1 Tax=Champsocephalus esox TaxID=159716 RepID=A0AAN8HUD1_9TELE|nr:hypothetical protein CesoFtcFv8_000307 [Champsocephalus esox]
MSINADVQRHPAAGCPTVPLTHALCVRVAGNTQDLPSPNPLDLPLSAALTLGRVRVERDVCLERNAVTPQNLTVRFLSQCETYFSGRRVPV